MSGKRSRSKGRRRENRIRELFERAGKSAERCYQYSERDCYPDVLTDEWAIEVKDQATLPPKTMLAEFQAASKMTPFPVLAHMDESLGPMLTVRLADYLDERQKLFYAMLYIAKHKLTKAVRNAWAQATRPAERHGRKPMLVMHVAGTSTDLATIRASDL